MADYMVKAITSDGAIRVVAVDTTELCNKAQKIHNLSATASAALGRALTAVTIMGGMLKSSDDAVTLQLNGGGPIGRVVAVSNGRAQVKGYVGNPLIELPLNEKGKLFHAKKIFEFFSKIKCNFIYCLLINCFPFKFYFMSNL